MVQSEPGGHPGDPAPARCTSSRPSTIQENAAGAPGLDPAAVKLNIISDRTETIRASVSDVQFTLMLTIALVVMVIFIFLRNFWRRLFQR